MYYLPLWMPAPQIIAFSGNTFSATNVTVVGAHASQSTIFVNGQVGNSVNL
jgi:hypothetical protein